MDREVDTPTSVCHGLHTTTTLHYTTATTTNTITTATETNKRILLDSKDVVDSNENK